MIRSTPHRYRRATASLVSASALLAASLTACANPTGDQESAKPTSTVNPAGQLSATGAPKLRFRPVLGSPLPNFSQNLPNQSPGPLPTPAKQQLVEPIKATTPERRQQITDEKHFRQSTELLGLDNQTYDQVLDYYQCPVTDLLAGEDDPTLPLVTCDADNTAKFVLGPVFLDNTQVIGSDAGPDPQGVGHVITLRFTDRGAKVWSDFTTANVQKQVALVFNTTVLSAPNINEPITGGSVQIPGAFDRTKAEWYANQIAGR